MHNDTCPKCNGINVNDRIKRQQGYLDGSIKGSGSSYNFSSFNISEVLKEN